MMGQRKSFLGSDAEEVDNQVDGWLAKSKVHGTNGSPLRRRNSDLHLVRANRAAS